MGGAIKMESHVLRSISACGETKLPLPNNNILDVTKLKAFVDNKLNDAEMTIFLHNRVENTVGKGGNTDYQHFLLFLQCFPKPPSLG